MSLPFAPRTLRIGPSHWESPIFRLIAVALTIAGLLLAGQRPGRAVLALSGAYLAVSLGIWLSTWRLDQDELIYAAIVVDVAYVSLVRVLIPDAAVPLWLLYLLPMATGATAGRSPGTAAALFSLCGLLVSAWLPGHRLPSEFIWQIGVLATGLIAVSALSPAWMPELREKRFWPEVISAARGLSSVEGPDEVGARIVERARRLTRADRAWIWWCDSEARLRSGPASGSQPASSQVPESVDEFTIERLARGSLPLDEAFGIPIEGAAEVVSLNYEGGTAILGVGWEQRHGRRGAWRPRLQAFTPWAEDALNQATTWEQRRVRELRGRVLRQAAYEWGTTQNPMRAQEAAIRAVQQALQASAAVLDRASGRALAGDSTVAAQLDSVVAGWLSTAPERSSYQAQGLDGASLTLTTVRGGLALALSRADTPLDNSELDWLEELAAGLGATLDRCSLYAAIEAEAERLRAAVDAMPAPVALWDATGRLLLANHAYSSLSLGASPPVVLPLRELVELETTAGEPVRMFVTTALPVMGGRYLLAHHREVTREREALRAKDELIAMVGHELKSPLTSIRGYSQMMTRQLRIVQSQVVQLDALISDFVEASQREGGQLSIARERIALADIAREASERFRGAHEGRTLRLNLDPGAVVEGDSTRLGQVVDNLLGNAAKYSPAERPITLSVEQQEGLVVLWVRDEGIGIAPEHLHAVFDRFYRLPASAEHVKGLGLGLSIVRDLVAAHSGRVWVESEGEGKGSTFYVSLPEASTPVAEELNEAAMSEPG
jgi:signal transduction histidine kinase